MLQIVMQLLIRGVSLELENCPLMTMQSEFATMSPLTGYLDTHLDTYRVHLKFSLEQYCY